MREYCQIPYLVYDDVVAFPVYGTLGLKCPMADHIWYGSSDFKGYIALNNLFIDVMTHLYRSDVMNMLYDDIDLWTTSLEIAALSKKMKFSLCSMQHFWVAMEGHGST